MINILQNVLFGLALGGVYALMASGLTLIFGVMRIVNLAHPAFVLMAAYLTWWLFGLIGLDPILMIPLLMALMFVLGLGIYQLVFAKDADNPRFVEITVLVTFAMALILEGVLATVFTTTYRLVQVPYSREIIRLGEVFLPQGQFYAAVVSIVLLVGLWAFLQYTRLGYAIRATMQNRTAAQVVGVNVNRVSMLAFGIGLALAGASGALQSFLFSFFPARHWEWIAILMALIVLGGMGSLLGAVVAGFLLSVAAALVSSIPTLGATWSPLTFFLTLFLILLIRPQGLFGKKMEAT